MAFNASKFQKGLDIATGISGLLAQSLQKGMAMADVPEENIQEEIDDLSATTSNAGSYRDLLDKFNTTNWAKTNYNMWDLTGMTGGEAAGKIALDTLGGAASGAQFGNSIVPGWGALVGAAVGGTVDALSSGFGWLSRKVGAHKNAQKYNREGEIANNLALSNMQDNAINIGKETHNTALLNRAAFGGPLYINDVFTNGVRKIEEGGSHSENPLGGVPMGIAADGLENLVEEGELIYKDYVFSQRLMVPEANKAILGLSKNKDYTFAEAANELQKESEERPNDPISKRTLDEMMGRLQESQETVKAKKEARRLRAAYNKLSPLDKMNLAFAMQPQAGQMANGGHLFWKGGDYTNRDSRYVNLSQPEWERIMFDTYGPAEDSTINPFVTEGKNRLPITGTTLGFETVDSYGNAQLPGDTNILDKDGNVIGTVESNTSTAAENKPSYIGNPLAQSLRAASVFGSLAGAIGSLFDKPNYSNIRRAEKAMAAVPRVSAGHVGQKLTYNPLDINYLMTQTANQGIGARRALVESGAGPQAIIAGNYGTQTAMGQNLLAALAQNEARKAQVAEFNRGTDTTNIGNDLQAALANQRRDMMGANFLLGTAPLRNAELATVQGNRSAQITNALNQLSNYGTDIINRDMAMAMAQSYGVPYNPYMLEAMGTIGTKRSAKGGKLNTKKGGKHA